MPQFQYKAYDLAGQVQSDSITADSQDQAFRKLSTKGLTVVSISQQKKGGAGNAKEQLTLVPGVQREKKTIFSGGQKVKLDELVVVSRELAIMIAAGIPVIEALASISEHAKTSTMRKALTDVSQEIIEGKSFSMALRSAPHVFPNLYCDIVKVAEEGGKLNQALESGASYMENALELKRKVMSALMYPIVLLVISAITVIVLITFVLPRFSKIFTSMNAEIPMTTKMLLNTSLFCREHFMAILGCIAFFVVVSKIAMKQPKMQRISAKVILRIPFVGDLVAKVAVSRMLNSLSTMLEGNVPLLTALSHCSRIVNNPVLEEGLITARSHVEQGRSFSDSLMDVNGLPALVSQMAQVGEKTGQLAQVMKRTSEYFTKEVDNRLKSLTSIIEPIMIVVLGIVVGFITLSVVTPIYSLVGSVK